MFNDYIVGTTVVNMFVSLKQLRKMKVYYHCLVMVWQSRLVLCVYFMIHNRSHSTYGSRGRRDSHRAVFCPNSVVSTVVGKINGGERLIYLGKP